MLALRTRIFADHYQFYVHDSGYEHYDDPRLDWSKESKLQFGYMATERAIYVSTKSDLNDHCISVFVGERPNASDYETCFFHVLEIESGKLLISSPSGENEEDSITIENGRYKVSLCGKNIGFDMFSFDEEFDEEMTDEEYCKSDMFESYDIYIENA